MGIDGRRLSPQEFLAAQLVVARLTAAGATEQFASEWIGLEWEPSAGETIASIEGTELTGVEMIRGAVEVLWELVAQMSRATRMTPAEVVSRLAVGVAFLTREGP